MRHPIKITALALILHTGPALADQVFNEDVNIKAGLCVGDNCLNDETFDLGDFDSHLRMKGSFVKIEFVDVSGAPNPDRDWALRANQKGGGSAGEEFFLEDLTEGTTPFVVKGGAPDNTLFVDATGQIGMGTTLPQSDLHLLGTANSTIRLESTNGAGGNWEINGNRFNFQIGNRKTLAVPFYIQNTAAFGALTLGPGKNVGVGTTTPDAPLEVEADDTFTFFRLTATQATTNQNVDIVFTEGPLGTGQLRYNIVEAADSPQVPEMTLDADGNMALTGMLTTTGSCSVGCDRVFDADYALKSIEDHQAQMWSAGYLPNVGPTPENGPFNVSDKMGRMLNELEHAHIYIGQQQTALHAEQLRNDQQAALIASLITRLDALESTQN